MKKILLAAAALVGLVIAVFVYSAITSQEQYQEAANPCERACLQDSGGLAGCREHCASHPETYGPASQQR